MAQVTLYLPDDLAQRIREEAKKAHKSISAYMTELAIRKLTPSQWPEGFADLYASWHGDFPVPEDLPPDDVEPVE